MRRTPSPFAPKLTALAKAQSPLPMGEGVVECCVAPSTTLRVVPLPRFTGEDLRDAR